MLGTSCSLCTLTRGILLLLACLLHLSQQAAAQDPYKYFNPSLFVERSSTKSNIEFPISNDGMTFSTDLNSTLDFRWPRGSELRVAVYGAGGGLCFGCQKSQRRLVSLVEGQEGINGYAFRPPIIYFNQFVPGTIGDPYAEPDTVFRGKGWKYSDDLNYILYASTDYDAGGVDISGNNLPDWPIRLVDGEGVYVWEPLARASYKPVYRSDEDFFCVYKDTDVQSDPEYYGPTSNPDSFSVPIGIEVRQYCYSWGSPALKDAVVLVYEIHNKSGHSLDSCFATFECSIHFLVEGHTPAGRDTNHIAYYDQDPRRNLVYSYNLRPFSGNFNPPIIGHLGVCCLDSPTGATGQKLGLTVFRSQFEWYLSPVTDSSRYAYISARPGIDPPARGFRALYGTGPFTMQDGDSVVVAFGIMFANGMQRLLNLDALLQRVYDNDLTVPSPPSTPAVTAASVEGGILIQWDNLAERSVDAVIPDSLGKPFAGYRLYRSRGQGVPFVKVKEWRAGRDSLVHEYLDRGQDGNDPSIPAGRGLTDNVTYLYRLTAFDEGVPSLEIPEMESPAAAIEAVPTATPSSPYALDNVRIVPNPYIVEHAAQKTIDAPKLFFNFLPEVCTIRIYTVALDLVAELHHSGGSAESWDLKAQGGQQVASQMFLAVIETPQGTRVTKKFAVVAAE
jgi:hypothetical protein